MSATCDPLEAQGLLELSCDEIVAQTRSGKADFISSLLCAFGFRSYCPAPPKPRADAGPPPAKPDAAPHKPDAAPHKPDSAPRQDQAPVKKTCATEAVYKIPVMVIRYFPTQGAQLDPAVTGLSMSLAQARTRVDQLNRALEEALERGSIYHGYRDPQASCSVDYEIVQDLEVLKPLPLSGLRAPRGYYPDYNSIVASASVCSFANTPGVKQVWLWAYHYGQVDVAESNMAGPYGDISNSMRYSDMPVCGGRTYTLFHFNYGRSVAMAVENHTHQMEHVFRHLDEDLFWNRFVNPTGKQTNVRNGCGWTHFPPNVPDDPANSKDDYNWTSTDQVISDCGDWNPLRNGQTAWVSCKDWGCAHDEGLAFKIWWMQNLPGKGHGLKWNGRSLRNFWQAIANFDQVMSSGGKLTE